MKTSFKEFVVVAIVLIVLIAGIDLTFTTAYETIEAQHQPQLTIVPKT